MQAMGYESVLWKLCRRGKTKEREREREKERRIREKTEKRERKATGRGSTFDRCTQIEMVRTRPFFECVHKNGPQ